MAGVYVHIPFCKSRCKYCDFYSTLLHGLENDYIDAIIEEINIRKDYILSLDDETISTIYFGGGTPSLLKTESIERVINELNRWFEVKRGAEISIEANPNDITREKLRAWRGMGVNRLSIGIQSFDDQLLRLIGRRHNAEEARKGVRDAQAEGFENVSIDLIYGLPTETIEGVKRDVEEAMDLEIQHVSTYCLSYEEGTRMTKMLEEGEIEAVDEETENKMYELINEELGKREFHRYEVSNFAREGYESRHNSSYWHEIAYLGLGASAHSYDGWSRQWNIDNIEEYIQGITARNLRYTKEILTETDKYNEKVMTELRTSSGIDLNKISKEDRDEIRAKAGEYIERGLLRLEDNHLRATDAGINILNLITENLMR